MIPAGEMSVQVPYLETTEEVKMALIGGGSGGGRWEGEQREGREGIGEGRGRQ